MSGNILFLGKKIFEIPPFFQTRPGDLGTHAHYVHALKSASGVFPFPDIPFAPVFLNASDAGTRQSL